MTSAIELTQWCDEHDLPMRTIRTGDDRIVCWFIWWVDCMERCYPIEDLVDPIRPPIKACIPGYRAVLAQGFTQDFTKVGGM